MLLLLSAPVGAQQAQPLHMLAIENSQELHQFFRFTGDDVPLISGHRGGATKGFPENCIGTFENTLRYTPAFLEVDPRLTKDNVIILMHDATLDRTTTGAGKVSDYTWAQLKELKLKDPEGNITPHRIPTLDEAIQWSKGKTVLNLDKKDVPLEMLASKLREHRSTPIMLTVHNAQQAKFYLEDDKDRMFSAFVRTRAEFEDFEKTGIPWSQMIAYIGPRNKPENKELCGLLHARGVMCMVSAAPIYDKLPDAAARATAYREILQAGVNVIESDRPIEAAAAIQSLIPTQSSKHRFFTKP